MEYILVFILTALYKMLLCLCDKKLYIVFALRRDAVRLNRESGEIPELPPQL
jgi:hypothetical protein